MSRTTARMGGTTGFRPTVAEVDLDAIRDNIRALRPPSSELMAVVKADGYGHGAVEVARAALGAGATWLGVALVEEAMELRNAGIDAPVLVLSESPPGSAPDMIGDDITPTVYTDGGVDALVEAGRGVGREPPIHVKVDTGMHRAGLYPETHFDLVRIGVALYGLDPGNGLAARAGIRPALAWRSAVSAVRRLPAGEAVSYGHHYRLDRAATVATVPVGYADGYPRILSSRGDVLIGGRRRRIAGTITMDQLMADCGDDPVEPGDEVVLIGRQGDEEIAVGRLALLAGTIDYEIACGIGSRVPRAYLGAETA